MTAILGLLAWMVLTIEERPPAPAGATWADRVSAIADNRRGAIDRARQAAARDWAAAAPAVLEMLSHDDWRVRAAACHILADHLDEPWLALLVPRASDADWRVRAAAMSVLARRQDAGEPPLVRDTPLEAREAWLLRWLDAHDSKAAPALAPNLCELYAGAAAVEVGRPLAARCLACHAGAKAETPAAYDACRQCHPQIADEWAGSAHAQSLSHLALVTVDPETRQPEPMDFGEVRGIGCGECHRAAGPPRRDVTAGMPRGTECPLRFDPASPAAQSCARCHATTQSEWQAWQAGRQPRRAVFPPGQIDVEFRGDRRPCADCHMTNRTDDDQPRPRRHDWSARRDAEFLRQGLDVRAARGPAAPATPTVRFTLTNLAGHAYPTGTRRRAVRLYAGPAAGDERLVVSFSPVRPGRVLGDALPALAPGEQKAILAPLAPGAGAVAYRLMYFRDTANPEAYVAEILSATQPLGSWLGP